MALSATPVLARPAVAVHDASQVGEARRRVAAACRQLGFDEVQAGRAALVVTEAGTNLVKHGGGGTVLLRAVGPPSGNGGAWLEILAADQGPGIENMAESLRDGYSTAGSPGSGLGAIRRLSDTFDVFSAPGQGTVVLSWISPRGRPARSAAEEATGAGRPALPWGCVCVPMEPEPVPGDGCDVIPRAGGARAVVSDGLGHGEAAHEASVHALQAAREALGRSPADTLQACHDAMRATRGGAVAIADLDLERRVLKYAGIGNIAGHVLHPGGIQRLVSVAGTVGASAIRTREFSYPWHPGSVLVMHSDGLHSRWDAHVYPGLLSRHPSVVAAVLFRDHARGRDDATVLVAREEAP